MKITFIDPPDFSGKINPPLTKGRRGGVRNIERVFGCTYSLYPMPNVFSLSSAAFLENNGFAVSYLDMANEGWRINRFKKFLLSDDSGAYVFHSVNLSLRSDLLALDMIREAKKEVPVIFTGPAPTYFTGNFLKDNNVFAVRGEPEWTLVELGRCLEKRGSLEAIRGLSFLRDGAVFNNPPRELLEDLDALPFPARHLIKNKKLYYNPKLPKMPFTAMQTSRNCSYQCTFCVPNSGSFARELEHRKYSQNQKPPVRTRSAGNVIEEFRTLKSEGYKSVSIIDDQFLWAEARTIEICEGIKSLGIVWGCLARADHITDTIARQMSLAGCRYIDMGVESFNQEVLSDIRKNLDVQRIPESISILKRNNILAKINLILGASPLQTKEVMEEDIRKAKRLDVDAVMFSLATPFPGTEFYRQAKENKWFIDGDYHAESVQSKTIISYPGLSNKELNWIIKRANLSFYFSLRFVMKNLKRLGSPLNFCRGLLALKRKFF